MSDEYRKRPWFKVPAGTKAALCKGETCQKMIYFVSHPDTGRPHPVDCDVQGGEEPTAIVDPGQTGFFGAGEQRDGRGRSHFDTCPDAVKFRRRRIYD